MEQTLELVTENFHSLLVHDFNVDGISEVLLAKHVKNGTDIRIVHPKELSNNYIRINEKINTMSIAQTSFSREFELITGDYKGVVRINGQEKREFFSKDVKDGIRLPSNILCSAHGDMNGNKLSEIIVGCQNGEVIMIERIPGKKQKWDKIRGFSLGKVFDREVRHMVTGDFNGNGHLGFITGTNAGNFKEIEYRAQLQKFDLIGEINTKSEPSYCFAGDIDRDGISEVFIGDCNGTFNVYKKNKLMSEHDLGGIITCGVVGDVDNNRDLEVVVGTQKGSFHILRYNTIESYHGYSNINDLQIGDIKGTRQNNLIFSIDKKRIVSFQFRRNKQKEKPNIDLLPTTPFSKKQKRSITPMDEAFCPNCQQKVRFIEQYRRYYCYNCRQYVAPVKKQRKKDKQKPMLKGYSYGDPYRPIGSPYSPETPYQPEQSIKQQAASNEDNLKTKMKNSLSPSDVKQDLKWEENTLKNHELQDISQDYFLPLDLEADLDYGANIFNDILKIKHVIIIHSDSGVPMFSQSFGKEIDVSLTSGFLSAVGTFTEEMSGETKKREGIFSEIGREGFWILIYEGKFSKTAILISEKLGAEIKKRIKMFMNEFEQKYKEDIQDFRGFVSSFSGATDLLEKHLRIEYLYPLKIDTKRMRLTAITKNEKVIAKAFTDFKGKADGEVFYITELINMVLNNTEMTQSHQEILKIFIKYLENGMLIPLPPPPIESI